MSEVLLQMIAEKLDALGAALSKPVNTGTDTAIQETLVKDVKSFQTEMKKFDENLKVTNANLSKLTSSLDNHTFQSQPLRNNVEHRHHLHKGIWVGVILFNISIFLALAWNSSLQTQKQYEANDIKYRSLKVTGNKSLIRVLFNTDSLYNIQGEALRKMTIKEEQRLAEQAEILRLAGEKESEAKELKRKAGKK